MRNYVFSSLLPPVTVYAEKNTYTKILHPTRNVLDADIVLQIYDIYMIGSILN